MRIDVPIGPAEFTDEEREAIGAAFDRAFPALIPEAFGGDNA